MPRRLLEKKGACDREARKPTRNKILKHAYSLRQMLRPDFSEFLPKPSFIGTAYMGI